MVMPHRLYKCNRSTHPMTGCRYVSPCASSVAVGERSWRAGRYRLKGRNSLVVLKGPNPVTQSGPEAAIEADEVEAILADVD